MHTRREGMLRPEFQDWYPTLEAERWYPADQLTEMVVDHLLHGSPQWRPQGRIPSDDHFVFRGGTPRQGLARRTRRSDQPAHHQEEPAPSPWLDS
jgi:hypothetical protein